MLITASSNTKMSENDKKKVIQLSDLISKCFILDPNKRLTVEQALSHPFIKDVKE